MRMMYAGCCYREVNTEEVCFQTEGRRGAAGTLRQVYTRNATPAFGMKKVETSATQGSETFYHPNGVNRRHVHVAFFHSLHLGLLSGESIQSVRPRVSTI